MPLAKILVIDDEPSIHNVVTAYLKAEGYEFQSAMDGPAGLAAARSFKPDIIILDEPTRGIDVGAKRDIYILMGELAKAGKAILMISSEIPELMGVTDRIIVLAAGRLTGEIRRGEYTQEDIMRYASKFEAVYD